MTFLTFSIVALLWWIIGFTALSWDWTRDRDLDLEGVGVFLFCGLVLGPLAIVFLGGRWLCRNIPDFGDIVVLRRRD